MERVPITHHLLNALDRPSDWEAIRFKRHKNWLSLTWRDYYESCEAAGSGLAELGLRRGDRIAILSNTRMEWAVADFGALGLGAVVVPIYQSHRPDEIEYVLHDSKPGILIVENTAQLRKWEMISKRCKFVEQVICIQPDGDLPENTLSWDRLLSLGVKRRAREPDFFSQELQKSELDDIATIVYTSGTSGEPKGAILTHRQVLSEVEDLSRAFPISPMDSTLTFLPYAHVLGRVEMWLHTYAGFTLNFAESIDRLRDNLIETRPTVMIGVPRIFEKIYAGLLTQIEGHAVRKFAFSFLDSRRDVVSKTLANVLIYSKLRQGLGGRLRFVVSGGAPLEPTIGEFFYRAGLLILEGYGLTETTAAICANTPQSRQTGTVGRPLADVQIQLAGDGEILVKSKKVFVGYLNDEGATASALQDGWFRTGDIGELTPEGYLRITDRKKDLIKTAGGKYVAPQKLEGLLKLNPLISHVLIHGDRKKYIVALVTLNAAYLKQLARDNHWSYRDYRSLTQMAEVHELVRKAIAETNAGLASFETIKNFAILPDDFSVEGGELTPSLKVKRRVLDQKYADAISGLY